MGGVSKYCKRAKCGRQNPITEYENSKVTCRFLLVRFKEYEIQKPMKIHIFHEKMQ